MAAPGSPRLSGRALRAALLGLLALAAGASAQERSADVPAGPARVEGRLVHDTRPEAAADVEVLLYALSPDGGAGLRATRSDAEGAFRFEDLSNDPGVVYLVGARAGEIPFGQRFQFAPGETVQRVELALSDPLADTAAARPGDVELRLERGCTHLRVEQNHQVENPGARVIFVPEEQRAQAAPIFEVELPEAAEGFESLLGSAGLEREGRRVRFWGPLYPGEQSLAFGYGQPLELESLELGFPRGARGVRVLLPRDELALEAPALRELDPEAALRIYRADAVAPGGRLALRVAAPARPASDLRATRAELWLELDDAALDVSERLELVAPEALEGGGAPLLCLPLPREARALRFSDSTLAAGLRRDPSGDLALHGPLPAGPSQIAVSYRLPVAGGRARLVRRFDRELPLLSVLIADTGVVTETERLHRRRPMRTEDRIYLHWEAFAVQAGEPVELVLRQTATAGGGGRWAATGFGIAAGLAALLFLAAPLRGEPAAPAAEGDPRDVERLALARALEDLDEDLETGKLEAADHAALRAELRGRAAALLLAPRPQPAATAEAPPEPHCAACRAPARPSDRFCAQCGAALPGPAPAPGAGRGA